MDRDRLRQVTRGVVPPERALERLHDRRDKKRRRARIEATIAGLCLVGLLFGALVSVLPRGGGVSVGPIDESATVPPVDKGDYFYREITFFMSSYGDGATAFIGPFRMETWSTADGSGRFVYIPDAEDPGAYGMPIKRGAYGQDGSADVTYGPGESPFSLIDLSRDPDVLRKQLAARSGEGGASPGPEPISGGGFGASDADLKLMRVLDDLLTDDVAMSATPRAQQGMFAVMRALPDVVEYEGVTDPVGRPAVALAYDLSDTQPVFYFDPQTHLVLATAEFFDGTADFVRIVQREGVVASTGAKPEVGISLIPQVSDARADAGARSVEPPG